MKIKRLLRIDFFLGFTFGIIGLLFSKSLVGLLQIPGNIIVLISLVTLLYSFFAFYLAQSKTPAPLLIKMLIMANWLWLFPSAIFLYLYFPHASIYGRLYLVLQIIGIGGLAYLEGQAMKQETKNYKNPGLSRAPDAHDTGY